MAFLRSLALPSTTDPDLPLKSIGFSIRLTISLNASTLPLSFSFGNSREHPLRNSIVFFFLGSRNLSFSEANDIRRPHNHCASKNISPGLVTITVDWIASLSFFFSVSEAALYTGRAKIFSTMCFSRSLLLRSGHCFPLILNDKPSKSLGTCIPSKVSALFFFSV